MIENFCKEPIPATKISYAELIEAQRNLVTYWGEDGAKVIENAFEEHRTMPLSDFMHYCTSCGGDWGGMFLTGIQELFPHTYEAIPDKMGVYAWLCICSTLTACGVWID